jgi:hypothetical protein
LTGLVLIPLVISLAWVIQAIAPLLIPFLIIGGTMTDYLRCTGCCVLGNEVSLQKKMHTLLLRLQIERMLPDLYSVLSKGFPNLPITDEAKEEEKSRVIQILITAISRGLDERPNPIITRVARAVFTEWRRRQQEDPRPVFLILRASHDKNNALAMDALLNKFSINDIDQLTSQYRCVFIDQIRSVSDIENGLKGILSPIQHIWLMAHGCPECITLGEQANIDPHTVDQFVNTFSDQLTPTATLILSSCGTAEARGRDENIATMLSRRLPGHTVFAATDSLTSTKIILGEDLSVRVKFHLLKTRLKWLSQKFRSLFRGRGHQKVKRFANVTTEIISHN